MEKILNSKRFLVIPGEACSIARSDADPDMAILFVPVQPTGINGDAEGESFRMDLVLNRDQIEKISRLLQLQTAK